jgi:hypothetical protein
MKFIFKENKILIAIIGISICLFVLYLLSLYNNNKEGFLTLVPVTYSETTITDYNNYIAKLQDEEKTLNEENNTNTVSMRISVDDLQKIGVPENDVNNYIKTGSWQWSQGFIDAVKQTELNTPNQDPSTITSSITNAQKTIPEQWYLTFFGTIYGIGLNSIAKTKNLSCKIDPTTNKSTGDGMYTMDSSGNITSTLVDNGQLPTLIPGFTFLKEVCNPCDLYNGKYDCPFSVPDNEGKALFPGFIMEYAWNTNNNTVNDVTSSISHLF